jgi:hypothetical protein
MATSERAAEASQVTTRPERAAAAAVLAAGVGAAALGLLTTLAEASESVADWLRLSDRVGPLSGKVVYSVIVWLVAWAIFHWLVRPARLTGAVLLVAGVLLGLGLLGTFPIFFELFAPE